jgi:hypothetical protein
MISLKSFVSAKERRIAANSDLTSEAEKMVFITDANRLTHF